jgi:isoleucyl-tRNA synthetase
MIYKEYKGFNLPEIEKEILAFWENQSIFKKSIDTRDASKPYVFYEGPPSANGMPGIHHVVGRTIKDIFCRYKTLQGYRVDRKGGWDTHGLPVELQVEKELQITKEDIGTKISIEEYNKKCLETVMKYKSEWDEMTRIMGFWLDLDNPYLTYENNYIESVWHIVSEIYKKDLIYSGYRIQPYSPAAGTGLSTHELNQPGAYQDVTDTTIVACFEVKSCCVDKVNTAFKSAVEKAHVLAWTTTPWTLPSNTALTVGPKIDYALIASYNPYTKERQNYILAKDLISKWFKPEAEVKSVEELIIDDKTITYCILGTSLGADLKGIEYNQLLPFEANLPANIVGVSFKIIAGDFVTTTDGTGIVHTAPSFGVDDRKVAGEHGIGELKMVDMEGKFVDGMGYLTHRFVKNYRSEPIEVYKNPDVDIAIDLKTKGLAFNVQKYVHSYPHCWRTNKPIIYYPLDSWFIRMTSMREKLLANNAKINWKPESTGTGRFGQWLDNIQDWNFSRSRYWGIPMPIWTSTDRDEVVCVSGKDDLFNQITAANTSNLLSAEQINANTQFVEDVNSGKCDLHKPYIDRVTLVSNGIVLKRESDVLDVWFDSGSMPYAQWHYPFENQDKFKENYPADFIAEGVDQTRGWFYTLHAISTILFDSPAYKNVISNGLVLDKNGIKMSKSKGNVIDPFDCLPKYGADAVRWYIISNSSPWDNLKFDEKGVEEVKRKLFGTLFNTYSFFTLYANIDEFRMDESNVLSSEEKSELDRWIISKLNTLKRDVEAALNDYEPTIAARAIELFVDRNLSNWYIRLSRRRFWKNDVSADKRAAYETLYECLLTVAQLMSPIAPFFSEWLYCNLAMGHAQAMGHAETREHAPLSVHLTNWSPATENLIDTNLELRVELAQDVSSMILALRKKEQIKVRQPLQKVIIPILKVEDKSLYQSIEEIVKSEVNVKEFEYVDANSDLFVKSAKANFKLLGTKLGKDMATISKQIAVMTQADILNLELNKSIEFKGAEQTYSILKDEIEITTSDMPGYLVSSENGITLALDITLSEDLLDEGIARELINRVQNYRKDQNYNVTDKIKITYAPESTLERVLTKYGTYIAAEVLANEITKNESLSTPLDMELNDINTKIEISKL